MSEHPSISSGTDEALTVVAKTVAAAAIRGTVEPEWENYPSIGEHDWDAIQCWLESHATDLDTTLDEHHHAYNLLARRADPNV